MLIARLDHLALTVPDVRAAAADYALLLDQEAASLSGDPSTGSCARLQCDNIGLMLVSGEAAVADAVPMRLVFASDDLGAAQHRLARRGLSGAVAGDRLDLDAEGTHGIGISVIRADAPGAGVARPSDILGLDHVVVRTNNAERAVALYAGRLGLDLRLDRARQDIGVRQLFFVVGGLVVEVVQSLKETPGGAHDSIWGTAWRCRDIDAARARLNGAGIAVSEVRDGRKAGSRVATVKSHACGVPTLLIGGQGLERT